MPAGDLRIISWNLLHNRGANVEQIADLIGRHRPDLMVMQEATDQTDGLPQRAGGHYARVALPGRRHGLAAWCAEPLAIPVAILKLQRGLIVERVCQVLKLGDITVANVHLSHGQVLNRLQLRRIAGALPEQAAIIGDCNLVGSPLRRGFEDVGPRQATHRPGRVVPLRPDRCLVRGLACTFSAILDYGESDHRPIMVMLMPLPASPA